MESKTSKKLKKNNFPSHSQQIKKLHRIIGQVEGIERMILNQRYCPDIITQLKAASAALKSVESEIFKSHLNNCVLNTLTSSNANKEEKMKEVIKLIYGK